MAMRRACQKAWRILRKEQSERRCDGGGKFIFLNAIPDIECEYTSGSEHAPHFGKGPHLIWKKHHAKLARDCIEAAVLERKSQGIRPLPGDWSHGLDA